MKSKYFRKYNCCKCGLVVSVIMWPEQTVCGMCGRIGQWKEKIMKWRSYSKWYDPRTWGNGEWIESPHELPYIKKNPPKGGSAIKPENIHDTSEFNPEEFINEVDDKIKQVDSLMWKMGRFKSK